MVNRNGLILNKKILLLIVGILLILAGILGQVVKVGYLEEQGWQTSDSYPIGLMGVIWGILYCIVLWIKHLHPMSHPILWIVGVVPLICGVYIVYMMGGI